MELPRKGFHPAVLGWAFVEAAVRVRPVWELVQLTSRGRQTPRHPAQ